MLRVAVIGLGSIAPVHLDAIRAGGRAQLVAVCDRDAARKKPLWGDTPFYTDYERMLDAVRPDVVHICLPHHLHVPATVAAVSRGCHVLTEKPVARTCCEAEQLLGLEEKYGVHIGVCFQNRYNATSELLATLLREGGCGRVTGLRGLVHWHRPLSYYQESPWRASMATAGGGCMMNQAIHTIDLVQWLAGSTITTVTGMIGNLLDYGLEVEDTASALIAFENGAKGFVDMTVACYRDTEVQLEIQCESGRYIIRDKALYQVCDGAARQLVCDGSGAVGKDCYGSSHAKLIDRFYGTVLGLCEDYITVADALVSLRIIEAVRKSSQTGASLWL